MSAPSAPTPAPVRARAGRRILAAALTLALLTVLPGCAARDEPVRVSREALGTVVAVTAYPATGGARGESGARQAIDAAYDAMAAVERDLDVHDPDSAISRLNADIGDPAALALPDRAAKVFQATRDLGVTDSFSLTLLGATEAWGFESGGRVPSDDELAAALADPRYDLGGAAKGLALDEAAAAIARSGAVTAALISSGSTTITTGAKPGGEPWRIGVEDPRDPDAVVASIEARGPVTVSTSGDYQRSFESGGVRYHHILDPSTGRPARGLRSLTVVGTVPGLDSDILSTALFVMGADSAAAYAEEHGLGLVIVDDEGRTLLVPGPEGRTWEISLSPR